MTEPGGPGLRPGTHLPDRLPDRQMVLANERTFLAYVRTALALQVAGLGVLQFLTEGHTAVRVLLGLALVGTGSYVGLAGLVRYRHYDAAARTGIPMDHPRSPWVTTALVASVPLVAAVLLVVT